MSVRTRVDAPRRAQRSTPRRAYSADRVKSGAAQRAYARRRSRTGDRKLPPLPGRAGALPAGRLPFVAVILALLGCGLLATLVLTTHAAEDSYQLSDSRATNRRLIDERAGLQREVEAADSAPELATRARELGMIPAKDPARLLVAPDGTVTVVGDPKPAEGAPAPPLNTAPASPNALSPELSPTQGERLVPVTTTPAPRTSDGGHTAEVVREPAAPAEPAAPVPVAPAPDVSGPAPAPTAPPAQSTAPPARPVAPPAEVPVPVQAAPAAPADGVPVAQAAPEEAHR